MATKSKLTVPPVIKVGGSDESETTKNTTKRSEVTHKSTKEAETLTQVLARTEETIQELTRMLAESEDSKHLGVRGMPKLTPKQQVIQKELEEARARYKAVLKMMAERR